MAYHQYPQGAGAGAGIPNIDTGFNAPPFPEGAAADFVTPQGGTGHVFPIRNVSPPSGARGSKFVPLYQGWRITLRKVHKKTDDLPAQWKRVNVKELALKQNELSKMVEKSKKTAQEVLEGKDMKGDKRWEVEDLVQACNQRQANGFTLKPGAVSLKEHSGKTKEGYLYTEATIKVVLKEYDTLGMPHRQSNTRPYSPMEFGEGSSTQSFPSPRQQPQVHQPFFPQQPRPTSSYSDPAAVYESAHAAAYTHGMPQPPPRAPMAPGTQQPGQGLAGARSPIYHMNGPADGQQFGGSHQQPPPPPPPHHGSYQDPRFVPQPQHGFGHTAMPDDHDTPHAQTPLFGEAWGQQYQSAGRANQSPGFIDITANKAGKAKDKSDDRGKGKAMDKNDNQGYHSSRDRDDRDKGKTKDKSDNQGYYSSWNHDDRDKGKTKDKSDKQGYYSSWDRDEQYEDGVRDRFDDRRASFKKAHPAVDVHQSSKPQRRNSVHVAGSPRSKIRAWKDRASGSSGSEIDEEDEYVFDRPDHDSLSGSPPSSFGYKHGPTFIQPGKGAGRRQRRESNAVYSGSDSGQAYKEHSRRESKRASGAFDFDATPRPSQHSRHPSSGNYSNLSRSYSQRNSGSNYPSQRSSWDQHAATERDRRETLADLEDGIRAAERRLAATRERDADLEIARKEGELKAKMAELRRQELNSRRRVTRAPEGVGLGGGYSGGGGLGGGLRSPGRARFDEDDDLYEQINRFSM